LHLVYLSLGSNLGDRKQHLETALKKIEKKIGKIANISSIYETEPWGFQSPNRFMNMAIAVETALDPEALLAVTQEIERQAGRKEKTTHAYKDRTLDIDILLYDDLEYNSDTLTIPHPRMYEREFVMKPMREIFL